MSTFNPQPDLTATEELVAYLDGELSFEASRRVEQRLATDAAFRRQLNDLDEAWSALDALPSTVVDDDFTRTTIEMVSVAAARDRGAEAVARLAAHRRQRIGAAALVLVAAAATFATVRTLLPNSNHELLADLPVIAQVDVLTQIGDVEFLRGLSALEINQSLCTESPLAATTELCTDAEEVTDWETTADRRAWIEQLSADQKAVLAAKFQRFQRLSPAPQAQDRLRRLEQQIAQANDQKQLQAALAAYAQWLARLTPGQQTELLPGTADERLARVQRMIEREGRQARRQLSPDDEKALQEAIIEFVAQRRQDLLEDMRGQGYENPQQHIADRSMSLVALGIIGRELRNDRRREEFEDRLVARLSPQTQDYLDELRGGRRWWQIWQWAREAMSPNYGPQELERFFVSDALTNDQREGLLSLPQTEMENRLEQLYVDSQLGLPADWRWLRGGEGDGRFGRGEPGPDRPGFERDRGRRGGPPPGGPPDEFGERRFERDRFERGPSGPPPNGPPRDRRDRRPPPEHGSRPLPEEPI